MRLPEVIEQAIDREATAVSGKALARAAEALSTRYRERGDPGAEVRSGVRPAVRAGMHPVERSGVRPGVRSGVRSGVPALTDLERLAYLIVRAPATYAAVATVLAELADRAPDLHVESLLDIGAGPGAATWAALAERGDIKRVTLIERDRGFISLGTRILAAADSRHPHGAGQDKRADEPGPAVEWRCADLSMLQGNSAAESRGGSQGQRTPQSQRMRQSQSPDEGRGESHGQALAPHDLVMVSYALDEIGADRLIERAWAATREALIVIEPGTPRHFAGVLAARDYLIHAGAFIAAPCPHACDCPMASGSARATLSGVLSGASSGASSAESSGGSGLDWCHMPARVERTSLHRRLKDAALPYEDEKFSYVIALRSPVARAPARIVRRPEVQKGFIALTLCAPEGLRREGIPHANRDAFRAARKATWGDAFSIADR